MINSQLYVDDPGHDLWMLEERLDSEDRGDFVESMLIMVLLLLKMGGNNRVGRLQEGHLCKWKETMTTINHEFLGHFDVLILCHLEIIHR